MAVTSEQLYEVFRELFQAFLENQKMVETARKTGAVLRYSFTNPTVKITINGKSEPPSVEYGNTQVDPDVTITMEWKVAHEFLMGRANAADLFLKKKLTVQPVSQAPRYMRLVPTFMDLLKAYPQIVEQKGLMPRLEG